MNFVRTSVEDGILTISLNQPSKRNALSSGMIEEILATLDAHPVGCRVVVVRAADDVHVWSAGHDVNELPKRHDPLLYSDPLERLLRAIRLYPAPVIAMVHGSVWGGATELALSCDVIIGDETCSFAITPANLGLPYNTSGLLRFMHRLPLNLVKEMFFTAAPIPAEAAARWGILNHLVPSAELEEFTYDMARVIASKAPLSVATAKEQLRILSEADSVTPTAFEQVQELRRRAYHSKDYEEGIRAFLEKRRPVFTGE